MFARILLLECDTRMFGCSQVYYCWNVSHECWMLARINKIVAVKIISAHSWDKKSPLYSQDYRIKFDTRFLRPNKNKTKYPTRMTQDGRRFLCHFLYCIVASETTDMTFEGLGVMFEGDSAVGRVMKPKKY